jgi:hypothetical protein
MQPVAVLAAATPKSASSASSDSTDLADDPDVAVVEMLMEPYFMQVLPLLLFQSLFPRDASCLHASRVFQREVWGQLRH